MRIATGWIGQREQLLYVLRTIGADRDLEGNFLVYGEPVIAGLSGDVVVPAESEYAVAGKRANLAALLSATSYGVSLRVF